MKIHEFISEYLEFDNEAKTERYVINEIFKQCGFSSMDMKILKEKLYKRGVQFYRSSKKTGSKKYYVGIKLAEGVRKPRKPEYTQQHDEPQIPKINTPETAPEVYDYKTRADVNKHVVNTQYRKRFFVTSASAGAPVNKEFLKAILTFCELKNAELVILPQRSHARALENQPRHFDPILKPYMKHFASRFDFNNKLVALDTQINPQQINPLTGMKVFGLNEHSTIIASPQQNWETVPRAPGHYPRILVTTGAMTDPDYLYNRVGLIADQQHMVGGVVVEIVDAKTFFIRHVQADKKGAFVDMFWKYSPNGTAIKVAGDVVLGDIHGDLIDPECEQGISNLMQEGDVTSLLFHDLFDGAFCNPHERNNIVSQASKRFFTLDEEIHATKKVFDRLCSYASPKTNIYVVRSNHDMFVDRYIQGGEWIRDSINIRRGYDIFGRMLNNEHPIADDIDPKHRANWLKLDEVLTSRGYTLSTHGNKGVKGARGNLLMYKNLGFWIVGHSHTPGMWNGSIQVGCSCVLNQPYTDGQPNDCLHAHAISYAPGQAQLVVMIHGKYKMED